MFPNEYITLLHRYLDARFGETLTTAEMDALFDTPTVDSDMPGYETMPHIRSDDVAVAVLKILGDDAGDPSDDRSLLAFLDLRFADDRITPDDLAFLMGLDRDGVVLGRDPRSDDVDDLLYEFFGDYSGNAWLPVDSIAHALTVGLQKQAKERAH